MGYCAIDNLSLPMFLRCIRADCNLRILHIEGNGLSGKGIMILREFHSYILICLINYSSLEQCFSLYFHCGTLNESSEYCITLQREI